MRQKKTNEDGREISIITAGKFNFQNSFSLILSEKGVGFGRRLFLCPEGAGGRISASAWRGGHRPVWTEKPPENRLKAANRGFSIMAERGKAGSGPLGHAPEVTAADQEGGASRPVRIV